MFYALDELDQRCEATPRAVARCPLCGGAVHARCGQIVSWHWAHERSDNCDDWSGSDSSWHREWKECTGQEHREVVIDGRLADLVTQDGIVIDLHQGSLDAEMVADRERHFDRMVWLLDARDAYESGRLNLRRKETSNEYATFRWKHARTSISYCKKLVFLDLDEHLVFLLKKIHHEAPVGGWGHFIDRPSMMASLATGAEFQQLEWAGTEGRRLSNGVVVR